MATAQRTQPRAVVGAPRRATWQLKFALRHSIRAAPRTKIFLHFFTIIVGEFLFMNNRGGVLEDVLGLEDVLEDTF